MSKYAYILTLLSFGLAAICSNESAGNGGADEVGNHTTTTSFNFANFTGVSVVGPFFVSVTPGPISVQVTVDSDVADLLDVRKTGQLLIV